MSTTSLMPGSTRSSARSLRIHTLPAITSTSVGATLSPIVCTSRDLGSIRRSVLSSRLPTQTDPSPTAGPDGLPPTGISPTIVSVPGSMTATESPMSSTGVSRPKSRERPQHSKQGGRDHEYEYDASARVERVGNRRCRTFSLDPLRGRPASPGEALERRIVAEDRALQLLQTGAGLDPELVAECPPSASVRLERLCLTTASVEGEHQLRAQALAVGVRRNEGLELGDERVVVPEREVRFDPGLDRRQAELLQARDLGLGEGLEGEVCKRGSPPKCEGIPKRQRSAFRLTPRELAPTLLQRSSKRRTSRLSAGCAARNPLPA